MSKETELTAVQEPERGHYLIQGATVVTVDDDLGTLDRADIEIEDGAIVQVGQQLSAPGAQVIEADDMIAMPGMVETHWHMWSSLGRDYVDDENAYFPAKWATSPHYTPEDFYSSVRLGLLDAVRSGITTVHNWSHNTRSAEHADAEIAAHRDGLIRARYSYGHPDLIPADQPLDFTDIDRVAGQYFKDGSYGLVRLGVNLRGPDLGDDNVFMQVELPHARERGLPISIHTMQGATTLVKAARLEQAGVLGPDFLIAHFLPATAEDRSILAATRTPVSWSMHSEMRLGEAGDPRAALLRMLDAGVQVSLSIDATGIAPVDLFEAMRIAWNMGIAWEESDTADLAPVTLADCIKMATISGAAALGLQDVVGSITPGKRADVILIRKTDVNVAPYVNPQSTIVRAATPANVDTVFSDGRILKRHGDLVAFDTETVVQQAIASSDAIRRRAGGRLATGL